ncbi:MAG: hypothetical protein KF691_05440 [Phycisphaeraceae bacterium]|nr:hypothetical protein [Phycisphaeraceae bacterium]
MANKNSASHPGISPRRRRVAALWASASVGMYCVSVLAQSLGAASEQINAQVLQCGPISDTIEYLLWLLRQL